MRKETYKVLIAAGMGVAAGLSACEATGVTNFIPDSQPKPTEPIVTPEGMGPYTTEYKNGINASLKEKLTGMDNLNGFSVEISGTANGTVTEYFAGFNNVDGSRGMIRNTFDGTQYKDELLGFEDYEDEIGQWTRVFDTKGNSVLLIPTNHYEIFQKTGSVNFKLYPSEYDAAMMITYDKNGVNVAIKDQNTYESSVLNTSFSPESLLPQEVKEKFDLAESEAAAGIPIGAELRGDAYFYTNSVNSREVLVAKIVDGKIVKEEFLNHKLVSCTASQEEILANELPGDFADFGGANKIAMFADNEKFPADVLTGQPIEKYDRTSTSGAKSSVLRWSREAQLFFDANPKKMPHQIMGCFSRKSELDGFTYIGLVHKWKNSDETYRYITTYLRDISFVNYSPDQLVFVTGWYTPGNPPSAYKFLTGLGSDPERNNILTKWTDPQSNYSVPPEAENSAFTVSGPEPNYKK